MDAPASAKLNNFGRLGTRNLKFLNFFRVLIYVGGLALSGCTRVNVGSTAPTVPPGTAVLSWDAPTKGIDGTPITNLAGYHVYYGTSVEAMDQLVDVPGAANTSVSIGNLGSGTYYFSVAAYTTAGIEGLKAMPVSKAL
jgi:hypothetical protein